MWKLHGLKARPRLKFTIQFSSPTLSACTTVMSMAWLPGSLERKSCIANEARRLHGRVCCHELGISPGSSCASRVNSKLLLTAFQGERCQNKSTGEPLRKLSNGCSYRVRMKWAKHNAVSSDFGTDVFGV